MTQLIPPLLGLLGLAAAFVIYRLIMRYSEGEPKIAKIGHEIHIGAMVFMQREYKMLLLFSAALIVLLWILLGYHTAIAFIIGAATSAVAGFIGMFTATKANVRTTTAAHEDGAAQALTVAFFGGSIMGLAVASLGLIGLGILFYMFASDPQTLHTIEGFGMGASTVALFSRVGGGIFTKSADVGADLVGKIEAGIPEDDPRNPGVIADNVGDNVGDVAGMGSDIFESYCGSMIATIAMAATLSAATLSALGGSQYNLMFLPLALASLGLLCSIAGIVIVRQFSAKSPEVALRSGTIGATIIFIVTALILVTAMDITWKVWAAVLSGAVGGMIIGLVTEYYTAGKPVETIAASGETGPATILINGFAIGMQSVVVPLLAICGIIWISTELVGLYGVGIAAVGMLSTVGITMAIDAYGPVADNAGGIAEMGGLGEETRKITDSLDELGNTTAAIGKGFAIGAAALAALAIISAFVQAVSRNNPDFSLELSSPEVLIGLFIGGLVPFLVASITMTAVGEAAFDMIKEIRRQFREIHGLLEGKADPDTASCVDIATTAALKRMILPGVIAVGMPFLIGFGLGPESLGGMLGGAWDNAKKYIEKGNHGDKGSDSHKAAVVGDTVGDPFKDTSGPSMNILINVMAIVSLVIAPLL